jgi:hypothetical protein
MGVKKVRFYHYILTLLFPPLTYFLVGRPVSFIANALVWSPLVYGLCFVYGIGFIFWLIAVFGPASHANIGAWERLRNWDQGYEMA